MTSRFEKVVSSSFLSLSSENKTERRQMMLMSAKLTDDESRESPVDPSTDHNHGQDVGQVSLHHVSQHAGIC